MASRCTVICLIILFFFTSIVKSKEVNKEQFIQELIPIILEAKKEIGGEALKVPNSLIVAQAAYESFWGTRYPKGNLFGLMSKGRPLKFPSVKAGMVFYLQNLLSHSAYEDFQKKIEAGETSPYVLVSSMDKAYSGSSTGEYAISIKSIIKRNNLFTLDFVGMEGEKSGV